MSTTEFITPAVPEGHPLDTDEAYQTEMLAKAESGLGGKPSQKEEEVKLLAGKYKSEEDLNKGILELIKKKSGGNLEDYYKSLEQDFHQGASAEGNAEGNGEGSGESEGLDIGPSETIPVDTDGSKQGDNKEGSEGGSDKDGDVPQVGIDFDKYNDEFTTNGTLSEDSIAEIVKTGIPQQVVEQYVEGLKALVELNKSHAFNLVGGEDNYKSMIKWAKATLNKAEIEGFNEAVATTDMEKRGGAIASLYKRFTEANPVLIDGDGASSTVDAYLSRAEMSRDINDPRYQKDPAFRQMVMDKLSRSKIM